VHTYTFASGATQALDASTVASFLGAFGTIGAVIVALFVQVYLVWRRRPALTMDISSDANDEHVVVIKDSQEAPTVVEVWVRLRVLAKRNRRTARGSRVQLVKVKRPEQDAVQLIVPSGPMIWSSVGPQPQSIISGMWLMLDVLRYRVESPGYPPHQLEVEVGYDFAPADRQSVLAGTGRYELTMLLGADDGRTSMWRLTFDHVPNSDATSDDELRALIQNIELTKLRTK